MVIISFLQGFYFNIFLLYNEDKNGDIVTDNDSNALMIIRHEPEPGFYSSMLSKQEFHTDRWFWHLQNNNNNEIMMVRGIDIIKPPFDDSVLFQGVRLII